MHLFTLRHDIVLSILYVIVNTGSLRAALMQSPVTVISTASPPLSPYTGQPKTCRSQQELSDLDCRCLLKDLPCRVLGSVCMPGGSGTNMKCECGNVYERELDKYCVERLSPEYISSMLEDPNSTGPLPSSSVNNNNDLTVSPVYRSGPKSSSRRPFKKAPFRTVMVTSNPLYAVTRPSRLPTRPTWTGTSQGVGQSSPSIDAMMLNAFPLTRPPLFSKNKFTGYHKGFVTKRPTTSRFFSRTKSPMSRVDGSIVVNGWMPDIWPAVGLNYSI